MTTISDPPPRKGNYAVKHGHSRGSYKNQKRSSEYTTWQGMKQRCSDPNCDSYEYYGGKGIKVCDRWMEFVNFLADMGPKPGPQHSIDRLDDSKDYEPENCRWATLKQQQRNKGTTVLLTFNGVTLPVAAWAERSGISYKLLWERLKHGCPLEIALSAQRYPRSALVAIGPLPDKGDVS